MNAPRYAAEQRDVTTYARRTLEKKECFLCQGALDKVARWGCSGSQWGGREQCNLSGNGRLRDYWALYETVPQGEDV